MALVLHSNNSMADEIWHDKTRPECRYVQKQNASGEACVSPYFLSIQNFVQYYATPGLCFPNKHTATCPTNDDIQIVAELMNIDNTIYQYDSSYGWYF